MIEIIVLGGIALLMLIGAASADHRDYDAARREGRTLD